MTIDSSLRGAKVASSNTAKSDRWIWVVLVLGVAALAILGGYAATASNAVAVGVFALAAYVCLLLARPPSAVVLTISLSLVVLSNASTFGLSEWTYQLRAAAMMVLLLLAANRAPTPDLHSGGSPGKIGMTWFLSAYAVYIVVATVWQGQYLSFAIETSGIVAFLVYAYFSMKLVSQSVRERTVVLVLSGTLLVSLALGFLDPSQAIVQNRLRGLTDNANLLGFFTALLIVMALVFLRRTVLLWPILTMALVTLWWTASRTSLAALIAGLLVASIIGLARARTILIGIAAVGVVVLAARYGASDVVNSVLFRTNNSRLGSIAEAQRALDLSPWIGLGLDSETSQVASTPLRAVVHAGFFGLAAVVVMYLAILVTSARVGKATFTLGVIAVVHSLAEGWMLAAAGPMTLLFVVCWITVAVHESNRPQRTAARPPGASKPSGGGVGRPLHRDRPAHRS